MNNATRQLMLFYQPLISLARNKVVGAEALARWNHPDRGLVEPDQFIQVAEGTRMIAAIDKWALFRVTAQVAEWMARYDLFVSMNVSAHEFSDEFLPDVVSSALELHKGLDPSRIRIELTERRSMDNPDSIIDHVIRGITVPKGFKFMFCF